MQDNLIPISLPFESVPETDEERNKPIPSCRVYVLPHKKYGDSIGSELIELYGIGNYRHKRESKVHQYIHWSIEGDCQTFKEIIKGDTTTILNLYKPVDIAEIITFIFPPGQLPESIEIGKHHYKLRDIVYIIEDILDTKILCRYSNRVIKSMVNASIEVSVLPVVEGVVIFGKKGISYLVRK